MPLTSPDFPAYTCYFVVLLVGALVAWSAVRSLLPDFADRLAFGATWLLLLVYTLLPVALFWFLDYTSAVRDTALFAAIFVAVAYQQIFSGGVKDITLPGATQALWTPFQKWSKAIVERISGKVQMYRERFAQLTLSDLEQDQSKRDRLHQLLQARNLLQGIQNELNALPQDATVARIALEWKTLRKDDPDHFGEALFHGKVISRQRRWWFLKRGHAKVFATGMMVGLSVVALSIWGAFFLPNFSGAPWAASLGARFGLVAAADGGAKAPELTERERIKLWYYRWRLRKANTSPEDRARTADFVVKLAAEAQRNADAAASAAAQPSLTPAKKEVSASQDLPAYLKPLDYVLGGVLHDFCSEAELPEQADRILPLVFRVHSAPLDRVVATRLLDCLETPNPDIRLRIQQTLTYLAQSDFPQARQPPAGLLAWVPVKDEPLALVDSCTRAWKAWWMPQFNQAFAFDGVCTGHPAPGAPQLARDPAKAAN